MHGLARTTALVGLTAMVATPNALAREGEVDTEALLRRLAQMEERLGQLEARQAELVDRAEAAEARAATAEARPRRPKAGVVAEADNAAPRTVDVRPRMRRLEPGNLPDIDRAEPSVQLARGNARLTISGQVNQSVLYANQADREQAFVADNDGSASRIGLLAEADFGRWTTGVDVVISAEANSTDAIDFGETFLANDGTTALGDFRQANWFIKHPTFGYLSVGQGDTAAEDAPFSDLSGTGFAGAEADVDDIAGGLTFDGPDGPLDPDVSAGRLDRFFDVLDDSRELRVLYRTPRIADFALSASLSNESGETADGLEPALGLRYDRTINDWQVAASAAWRREDVGEADRDVVTGSVSVLAPFGGNLTLAASTADAADTDVERPYALFAKLGYRADLFEFGETRVSVDGWHGISNPTFAAPTGALPAATSFGLFGVQAVDALNTEFYVGGRLYILDDVHVDGRETDVDDLFAVIGGARVSF